MDSNCSSSDEQREQHVKVGRCGKVWHVEGAGGVWVGGSVKDAGKGRAEGTRSCRVSSARLRGLDFSL